MYPKKNVPNTLEFHVVGKFLVRMGAGLLEMVLAWHKKLRTPG